MESSYSTEKKEAVVFEQLKQQERAVTQLDQVLEQVGDLGSPGGKRQKSGDGDPHSFSGSSNQAKRTEESELGGGTKLPAEEKIDAAKNIGKDAHGDTQSSGLVGVRALSKVGLNKAKTPAESKTKSDPAVSNSSQVKSSVAEDSLALPVVKPNEKEEPKVTGSEKREQQNDTLSEVVANPPSKKKKERPVYATYCCDVCKKQPIERFRWECNVCDEFDLCESCYKAGKNCHECTRFPIPPSSSSRIEPPPLLRQESSSTLARKAFNIPSSTSLKDLVVRLKMNRLKLVAHKKVERCLQGYEVAIDLYASKQIINKDSIPLLLERTLLLNSFALSGMKPSFGYLNSRNESDMSPLPFKAARVSTILLCAIQQILFMDDESSWFASPVPESVPNYHQIIKEPMDLGTVKTMLENGSLLKTTTEGGIIDLVKETARLVELIWSNARTFNPPGHRIHKVAMSLHEKSARVFANMLMIWDPTRQILQENGLGEFWKEVPVLLKGVERFRESETRSQVTMKHQSSVKEAQPGKKNTKRRIENDEETDVETESDDGEKSYMASANGHRGKSQSKHGPKTAVKRKASSLKQQSLKKQVVALQREVNTLNGKIDKLFSIVKGLT